MNKTVLYYTSNREDPVFEQKIIDDMLSKKGDMPIISISQKPMKLGQNICVGEVGQSYVNEWRQILIGAKAAKTEYLVMAESDFLYAPEYFQFEPKGENIYRYDNIWIMWESEKYDPLFKRKYYSEGAQIVKRKYFINLLKKYLKPFPEWYGKRYKKLTLGHSPYSEVPYTFFYGKNPCLSIKTKNASTKTTTTMKGAVNSSVSLRYWGRIYKLRRKFL